MRDPLEIAASLLEKVADYVDAVEKQKHDEIAAERAKRAEAVKTALVTTGVSVDEDSVIRLSEEDKIATLIENLAQKASVSEEFGSATSTTKTASTVDDMVRDAERRFTEYLMS